MTSCDLNAALSCLVIVGPLVSTCCVFENIEQLAEIIERIDPQGLIKKSNMTAQERQQFEILKPRFRKECIPLLRKSRIYSFCGIVGSTLTVPATVAAGPFLSSVILGSCLIITLGHTANLVMTTKALRMLSSNQQISEPCGNGLRPLIKGMPERVGFGQRAAK